MRNKGFTLVELLVVMSILGVLITLIAGGFRTAQTRGRDAQRKSDLKEIANALELFYSDYGKYPPESSSFILACPYNPTIGSGTSCAWGSGEVTDSKTIYFKMLPDDPNSSQTYIYRIVPGSDDQKYQLFARLENPEDQDCLAGNCVSPPISITCGGSKICNFSTTSANTTPME